MRAFCIFYTYGSANFVHTEGRKTSGSRLYLEVSTATLDFVMKRASCILRKYGSVHKLKLRNGIHTLCFPLASLQLIQLLRKKSYILSAT